MFEDVKVEQDMGRPALREEVGQDTMLNKVVKVDLIEEG